MPETVSRVRDGGVAVGMGVTVGVRVGVGIKVGASSIDEDDRGRVGVAVTASGTAKSEIAVTGTTVEVDAAGVPAAVHPVSKASTSKAAAIQKCELPRIICRPLSLT